jgi:hypothetical protein
MGEELLVLIGLVENPHQLRPAVAGHPDDIRGRADRGIQITGAAGLLEKGVEGAKLGSCGCLWRFTGRMHDQTSARALEPHIPLVNAAV